MLTKKGMKMSISKSFNSYQIEKSESVVTEVRGQHRLTDGYLFEDDLENNRIILSWQNDEFTLEQKLEKVMKLYELLDRHGFKDYAEFNKEKAIIYLTKFV